ncbi:MAG: ferritin family protein [Desulfuromonadales bacterium]
MPEFANAFSGLSAGRKLTHAELVRAIRYMIAAEYEAVQLYMQLAESTDHALTQMVLKDIADEELVHAGEFLTLLKELAPEENAFYAEGEEEVREMMAGLGGRMAGKMGEKSSQAEDGAATPEPPASTLGNLYRRE